MDTIPEPGTVVCLKTDPSRIGVIIEGAFQKRGTRTLAKLRWADGQTDVKMLALLKAASPDKTPLEHLRDGEFGKASDLYAAITHHRISGALENLIYSLRVTNTTMYPYQYRPLLTFLNSPSRGLLIADEVGLGKTIEAGVIWTELRMREAAERLLVVCPSPLCEKWQAELAEKFNVRAEIVDADELLLSLKAFEEGRRQAGAFIASIDTIRSPLKDEEDNNVDHRPIDQAREMQDPLSDTRPFSHTPRRRTRRPARVLNDWLSEHGQTALVDLLIVDEAHHIRNPQTQRYHTVSLLTACANNVLFLSATPIQTKTENLFTLLNLLDPGAFPYQTTLESLIFINEPLVKLIDALAAGTLKVEGFKKALALVRKRQIVEGQDTAGTDDLMRAISPEDDLTLPATRLRLINRVKRLNPLNLFVTRSIKRNVLANRCVRVPKTVEVVMTDTERRYYEAVSDAVRRYCKKEKMRSCYPQMIIQKQMSSSLAASDSHWRSLGDLSTLAPRQDSALSLAPEAQRVEHIAHPGVPQDRPLDLREFIDETDERAENEAEALFTSALLQTLHETTVKLKLGSALRAKDTKAEALVKFLTEYRRENSQNGRKKVLLFSYYKKTLSYLADYLDARGIGTTVIDGDTDQTARKAKIDDFRTNAADVLLSSEVVAEGLDLQFISALVNYDLPWNPAKIEQRIGRIDRLGQTEDKILIVNFIYKDTIESQVYQKLLERFGVFTRTLGVAEEILGNKINRLTQALFTHELTPAEEARLIEQTAFALENVKSAEEEAATASVVYDFLRATLTNASAMARYVTDRDLIDYVKSFCERDPDHSRLLTVDAAQNRYRLQLSDKARFRFMEFVGTVINKVERTRYFAEPELVFEFKNRHDGHFPPSGIERVGQHHPLIRFIRHWMAAEKVSFFPTASISLTIDSPKADDGTPIVNVADLDDPADTEAHERDLLAGIPSGLYAYRIEKWTFNTARDRSTSVLHYRAVHTETLKALADDEAELLINKAARVGVDRFDRPDGTAGSHDAGEGTTAHETSAELSLDRAIEAEVATRFQQYVNEKHEECSRDASFRKRQLVNKIEDRQRLLRLKEKDPEISPRALKGLTTKTQNEIARLNDKIFKVNQMLTQLSSEAELVSLGRVFVEKTR